MLKLWFTHMTGSWYTGETNLMNDDAVPLNVPVRQQAKRQGPETT